jgi:hypothetical protein
LVRCSCLELTFDERGGFECRGECPGIIRVTEQGDEGLRRGKEGKHLHKEEKQKVEPGMLCCQDTQVSEMAIPFLLNGKTRTMEFRGNGVLVRRKWKNKNWGLPIS